VCTKRFRGKFNAVQCAIVWNGFLVISTSSWSPSSSPTPPLPPQPPTAVQHYTLLLYYYYYYYYYTYTAVYAKYRRANSPDDRRQLRNMSIFQSRACEFVPTEETKIITLLLYAPNPKSRKRWYIILYIYNVIIIILYMLSGFDNIIMLTTARRFHIIILLSIYYWCDAHIIILGTYYYILFITNHIIPTYCYFK